MSKIENFHVQRGFERCHSMQVENAMWFKFCCFAFLSGIMRQTAALVALHAETLLLNPYLVFFLFFFFFFFYGYRAHQS